MQKSIKKNYLKEKKRGFLIYIIYIYLQNNFFFFINYLKHKNYNTFSSNNILFSIKFFNFSLFLKKKHIFVLDIFFKKYFIHKQQNNVLFEIINLNILFLKNISSIWFNRLLKKTSLRLKSKLLSHNEFLKLIFISFLSKDCQILLN